MVDSIEQRVFELIRPYAGTYLFSSKPVELTPDTDFDTDLQLDAAEAEDLMNEFFKEFQIERGRFKIEAYYPEPPFSWNLFKKYPPIPVPDFTIGMLIKSAKAGKWLYD